MGYSKKDFDAIQKGIIKQLKAKDQYEKSTDDPLIDSLLFNLKLIDDAKRDIYTRGAMVNIGKDKEFYQINFSISIFHNSVKSINTILKQLGLEKLKIEDDSKADSFAELKKLLN